MRAWLVFVLISVSAANPARQIPYSAIAQYVSCGPGIMPYPVQNRSVCEQHARDYGHAFYQYARSTCNTVASCDRPRPTENFMEVFSNSVCCPDDATELIQREGYYVIKDGQASYSCEEVVDKYASYCKWGCSVGPAQRISPLGDISYWTTLDHFDNRSGYENCSYRCWRSCSICISCTGCLWDRRVECTLPPTPFPTPAPTFPKRVPPPPPPTWSPTFLLTFAPTPPPVVPTPKPTAQDSEASSEAESEDDVGGMMQAAGVVVLGASMALGAVQSLGSDSAQFRKKYNAPSVVGKGKIGPGPGKPNLPGKVPARKAIYNKSLSNLSSFVMDEEDEERMAKACTGTWIAEEGLEHLRVTITHGGIRYKREIQHALWFTGVSAHYPNIFLQTRGLPDFDGQQTALQMMTGCKNSWEGGNLIVAQISNSKIRIRGLIGKGYITMRRTPPTCYLLRKNFPLIVVMFAALASLSWDNITELALGLTLLGVFATGAVVGQAFMTQIVELLPSGENKKNKNSTMSIIFKVAKKGLKFCGGLCAPVMAVLTFTTCGYIVGVLAVVCLTLSQMELYEISVPLQMGGNFVLTCITLHLLKFGEGGDKNLPAFLASTALLSKGAADHLNHLAGYYLSNYMEDDLEVVEDDDVLELQQELMSPTQKDDNLMEDAMKLMGLDAVSKQCLQALDMGTLEKCMRDETLMALHDLARAIVRKASDVMRTVQGPVQRLVGIEFMKLNIKMSEKSNRIIHMLTKSGLRTLKERDSIDKRMKHLEMSLRYVVAVVRDDVQLCKATVADVLDRLNGLNKCVRAAERLVAGDLTGILLHFATEVKMRASKVDKGLRKANLTVKGSVENEDVELISKLGTTIALIKRETSRIDKLLRLVSVQGGKLGMIPNMSEVCSMVKAHKGHATSVITTLKDIEHLLQPQGIKWPTPSFSLEQRSKLKDEFQKVATSATHLCSFSPSVEEQMALWKSDMKKDIDQFNLERLKQAMTDDDFDNDFLEEATSMLLLTRKAVTTSRVVHTQLKGVIDQVADIVKHMEAMELNGQSLLSEVRSFRAQIQGDLPTEKLHVKGGGLTTEAKVVNFFCGVVGGPIQLLTQAEDLTTQFIAEAFSKMSENVDEIWREMTLPTEPGGMPPPLHSGKLLLDIGPDPLTLHGTMHSNSSWDHGSSPMGFTFTTLPGTITSTP